MSGVLASPAHGHESEEEYQREEPHTHRWGVRASISPCEGAAPSNHGVDRTLGREGDHEP